MEQQVRVLIVEDDHYARSFISRLIQRDGRARVTGEIQQASEIPAFFRHLDADLILLGGEQPLDSLLPDPVFQSLRADKGNPRLIYAVAHPEQIALERLDHPACQGCLFKDEIGYSLVWALILAARGEWVITPRIEGMAKNVHFAFKHFPVILDGSYPIAGMTAQEAEDARLAFLFYMDANIPLADAPSRLSRHLHSAYRKLGIDQIITRKINLHQYFAGREALLQYFGDQLELEWKNTCTEQDQARLAFSLLTAPEIRAGQAVKL